MAIPPDLDCNSFLTSYYIPLPLLQWQLSFSKALRNFMTNFPRALYENFLSAFHTVQCSTVPRAFPEQSYKYCIFTACALFSLPMADCTGEASSMPKTVTECWFNKTRASFVSGYAVNYPRSRLFSRNRHSAKAQAEHLP